MTTEQPVNEQERREFAFNTALGAWLRAKQRDGAETADISQPACDIMYFFFGEGWSWGKEERLEECPLCYEPTQLHSQ